MEQDITITFNKRDRGSKFIGYKVTQGDKYADGLGYDELLGLIASMTMPEPRHCLGWLQTAKQHKAMRDSWEQTDIQLEN